VRKKRRKEPVNSNEIHHTCEGTRHKETLKTVKHKVRKCSGGGCTDFSTVHVQISTKAKLPLTGEQRPKQQRTRMTNRPRKGEDTNGRGKAREKSKEGEYG
jgi:hypothetical protein